MSTIEGQGASPDPRASDAVISDLKGWPGWTFTVTPAGGVTVTPPLGEQLDAVKWRRIPIGHIFGQARRMAQGDIAEAFLAMIAAETGEAESPRRSPAKHRQTVAKVYRLAVDWGMSPAEAIADAFGTTEVTARRWIASIRRTPNNPNGLIGSFTEEKEAIALHDAALRGRRAGASRTGNGRTPGKGSTAVEGNQT